MEFWGDEVKSGKPLKVFPGEGMVLHLSQACLDELKKEKRHESVCLFVNVDGKKLVLGTLFSDKLPQQQFDLVFDRDFELSHNWKNGSVYFYGYVANNSFGDDELPGGESDESESEDDIPVNVASNGKPETKVKQEKPGEADGAVDAKVEDEDEDDSEDDDESDEGDEETPKKEVETGKKRRVESASKTPVPDKKAKATPQKTDGKQGAAHVDTPHPAKKAGKTPADKPNPQTPKSGGAHSCTSCNRLFGSEKALESHSKAKHSVGK